MKIAHSSIKISSGAVARNERGCTGNMGLLDDLRNQADSQRASEEEEAKRTADRERFYQEEIQPRMIKAYQFFNELVKHLNYVKLETIVNYPLLPDGQLQPLRQEGYTVVIDSSKAIKRIDFTMEGVLETPLQFEIFGKDAVLKHADRIERYSFRHERKDRKDHGSMEIVSAKFTLIGPLPLKVTVEADVNASRIIVTVRNFNEPGFTKYTLTAEQFSDEFLDQLGKFVLRKEDRLFGKNEELSEEAKKKIRDRMIVEARIRQQELIEAEERSKAEEAAEREKSAKEQLKRAVNTTVSQSKESLKNTVSQGKESIKGMFNKLKQQALEAKKQAQAAAAQKAAQTQAATRTPQSTAPPAAKQQMPAAQNNTTPNENRQVQNPVPSAPNSFKSPGVSSEHKTNGAAPLPGKSASTGQDYIMSSTIKTAAPKPNRHIQNSGPSKANPFLKPEDLEEVSVETAKAVDPDGQQKPVLKPGELNTALAADLAKAQGDQEQDNQGQEENESTSADATAKPAGNPFLKAAGQDPDLAVASSPVPSSSAAPAQNLSLNKNQPNTGGLATSAPSRNDQKQQVPIAEKKPSPVAPAAMTEQDPVKQERVETKLSIDTSKLSLEDIKENESPKIAGESTPTQDPVLSKQEEKSNLSLNSSELSLEEIKEDSPANQSSELSVTTQNPALEQELMQAEQSLKERQLSLEQVQQDSSTDLDESAVTTQNSALEEELMQADLSLKVKQLSLEEVKDDSPSEEAVQSAVTTQDPVPQQIEEIENEVSLDAPQLSLEDEPDLSAQEQDESAEKIEFPVFNRVKDKSESIPKSAPPTDEQASLNESLSLEPTNNDSENPASEPDDIDIDLSANLTPSQADNDPEEKS